MICLIFVQDLWCRNCYCRAACLSRMEDKLDKLSEAVLAIARMEERMLTVFKRSENVDGGIKKVDDRIDEMEKQAIARGQKIAFAERIF